ncbi:hypothetical protein D3C75_931040 [compost metagenome]
MTHSHQFVGLIFSQNSQCKRTAHEGDRFLYSFYDITIIFAGDQVGNNLRIRFGSKVASSGNQFFLKVKVVLNNPVVYDREFLTLVGMRVGVLIGRFTVGCPACMPDSGAAGKRSSFQSGFQVRHASLCLNNLKAFLGKHGNPGRIIPTILQLLQSLYQDPLRILITDISYNTTHNNFLRPIYSVGGIRKETCRAACF